ncbi:hypothetical protein AO370_0420 [Moraxella catarrhalis]|uniref:Uncharacterized protein n=1 Tax=Moraxella catarrhalis TaxID=480 RepID=A0AB36DQM4_MORCA|nr:hypothetical protein AO370_0420 [Moraxella catarrhalis]
MTISIANIETNVVRFSIGYCWQMGLVILTCQFFKTLCGFNLTA